MTSKDISRREFLRALWLTTTAAAVSSIPQDLAFAAGCPADQIKGTFFLFMKGSFLDIQFGKDPDLHKNGVLEKTIQKLDLKPLKPEGFPYTGANSSNWMFVFDFGCNPPGPLTLTLTNKAGKKITLDLVLFDGTRYVSVLRGTDSAVLESLFSNGSNIEMSLNLAGGVGSPLWKSGSLKPFRPRSGGNGRDGSSGQGDQTGGAGQGDGSGSGGSGSTCFVENTLILMADGTQKPIQDVKVGERIQSYDVKQRQLVVIKVVDTKRHECQEFAWLELEDNTRLGLTPEHPLYLRSAGMEGWGALNPELAENHLGEGAPVLHLERGMEVLINGANELTWILVRQIDVQENNRTTVYSLSVEEPHTYFAEKILTHNKPGATGGAGSS